MVLLSWWLKRASFFLSKKAKKRAGCCVLKHDRSCDMIQIHGFFSCLKRKMGILKNSKMEVLSGLLGHWMPSVTTAYYNFGLFSYSRYRSTCPLILDLQHCYMTWWYTGLLSLYTMYS